MKSPSICRFGMQLTLIALSAALAGPASAQGFGESRPWQFDTSADKVNKAYLVDLMERKKGGYFDSFQRIINNTSNTFIDHQVNCSVTATSVGNSGTNAMDATTSSPIVNTTGSTTASTVGNQASNGVTNDEAGGYIVGSGAPSSSSEGDIDNDQENNDSELESGVYDSETEVSSGPIMAGYGQSHQVLNSDQSNTGAQTASVSDSTACSLDAGPLN